MNHQQEKEQYLDSIKSHTDRELLELQTWYAAKTEEHCRKLDQKMFFFWMLTILVLVGGLLFLMA